MNKAVPITLVICILTVMVHIVVVSLERNKTLDSILSTQLLANRMLKSQIEELIYTADLRESEVYNRGFEAGKTQLGLALMQGKSMVGYKEGYHAAITQFESFPPIPNYPPGFPPFPTPKELFSKDEE